MVQKYLIAGTGTGVGKTLLTALLSYQYTQEGYGIKAIKPILSGYADGADNDAAILLRSLGKEVNSESIHSICPWRYLAALSPHLAAHAEGGAPTLAQVKEFCQGAAEDADALMCETAGGIMSPLNDSSTMLDLAVALGWPVILVAGSYLGSISHTLTAIAAMQARGVRPHAVVISESEGGVALADVLESIRLFARCGDILYTLPRLAPSPEPWKHAPCLTPILSLSALKQHSTG